MTENSWKRKADALVRLAEDQRGKPEGDLAREKLLNIINNHPEAFEYEPIQELAHRDVTLKDLGELKRAGVSLDGSWTGTDFNHALRLMEADYRARLKQLRGRLYIEPPRPKSVTVDTRPNRTFREDLGHLPGKQKEQRGSVYQIVTGKGTK